MRGKGLGGQDEATYGGDGTSRRLKEERQGVVPGRDDKNDT